jgi:TPP-dependent pyruvate/acetoin dehydrogenase alpha subunit
MSRQRSAALETERTESGFDLAWVSGAFERMLLIRRLEEALQKLFLEGEVHGTVHLYNGQEAVSVGVCAALEQTDYVAATYRGHGAALAKGSEVEAVIAELLGRETGLCGGRGGSMNLVDHANGLLFCSGIIGGSIAAATGAALTAKRHGRVAVAFFGDGTVNQGYFHECANFARVLDLPLLLVCENNLYGEFTPMAQVTGGGDIAARGAGYGVAAQKVDGNDVEAVGAAAAAAVARIRAGGGPELVEALTYRHLGHSKSDPANYRPAEEVAAWLERDPLDRARRRLLDLELSAAELQELEDQVEAKVGAAVAAALAAPLPQTLTDAAREFAP